MSSSLALEGGGVLTMANPFQRLIRRILPALGEQAERDVATRTLISDVRKARHRSARVTRLLRSYSAADRRLARVRR